MFPITITINDHRELTAVLAALGEAPDHRPPARLVSNDKADIVREKQLEKEAAAPAPLPTSAATPASPAPTSPTAEVAVETAAPVKTAAESSPTAAPAAAEPQASTVATEAVTYEQVAAAITDMVKTDRAKAVATLAKFGVKKGPELKVEQYADFLAALQG